MLISVYIIADLVHFTFFCRFNLVDSTVKNILAVNHKKTLNANTKMKTADTLR